MKAAPPNCPDVVVEDALQLAVELRSGGPDGAPLHYEDVTSTLGDLVDETWTLGVLAEELPGDATSVAVSVTPVWKGEPLLAAIDVEVEVRGPGRARPRYRQRFANGRWKRIVTSILARLQAEGTADPEDDVAIRLTACPDPSADLDVPALFPPEIIAGSLEQLGIRSLDKGGMLPDRPVLLDARMVDEIIERTIAAGPDEIGAGTLGILLRLPEALPGTTTRVVTLLTACVYDTRHAGEPARVALDPGALAEAARIAELRGRNERVVTATHSHGWGSDCNRCNERACALPSCTTVSTDDYQVLEALFPSKSTVLPIAGRKPGAPGRRPVLEVHAWRGGHVTPIPWRRFTT